LKTVKDFHLPHSCLGSMPTFGAFLRRRSFIRAI